MALDFLAVGDVATDTFIRLAKAGVRYDTFRDEETLALEWGAKIPYEFAVEVNGDGNAGNAAVCAARLGLRSGILSWIGADAFGDADVAVLEHEGVDASLVTRVPNAASNHSFILWYGDDRTILTKHQLSPYVLPRTLPAPRLLYLSSAGDATGRFHADLARWLSAHPETTFAFQPGRELAAGLAPLKELYARADVCVMNREEVGTLLGRPGEPDAGELARALAAAGPKVAIVTDGARGACACDGRRAFIAPVFPDPAPPYERTGAGDAFASTVASALALGKPLEEALRWGPVNAKSVVQKIGPREGLLSRTELETRLSGAPSSYRITTL